MLVWDGSSKKMDRKDQMGLKALKDLGPQVINQPLG